MIILNIILWTVSVIRHNYWSLFVGFWQKKSKNNEAEKNVSMEQTRERVMRTGKVVWRGHTFQEHLHHRILSNISVNTY